MLAHAAGRWFSPTDLLAGHNNVRGVEYKLIADILHGGNLHSIPY